MSMLRWLLVALGALIALAAAAVLALPWLIDRPAVHAQIAQAMGHALGRPVRFRALSITALPLPAVRLEDLQLGEDPAFGPGPFVRVDEGRVRIRLRPLLSGRVELADLTLRRPRISVVQDAAGRLNIASLGTTSAGGSTAPRGGPARAAAAAGGVALSTVRVEDGALDFTRAGAGALRLSLSAMKLGAQQPVAGGPWHLSGTATLTPGDVRLALRTATLSPAPTRALGDLAVTAAVDVQAADVAPLIALLGGVAGVSGPMTGALDVSGTVARLSAKGTLTLDRATLTTAPAGCGRQRRQLPMDAVRVALVATPSRIDAAPVEAKVARGTVSFRASAALAGVDGGVALSDIQVRGVELAPILVDYLCQPYAVTGAIDLTGEAVVPRPGSARDVDGAGRLRVGPGKVVGRDVVRLVRDVVGLGAAVSAALERGRAPQSSPLDFDSITATYTIAGGVARTDDLVYRARDVRVAASGTYRLGDGRVAMELTLTEGLNQVKGFVAGAPGSLRLVPIGARIQDRDVRRFLDRIFR